MADSGKKKYDVICDKIISEAAKQGRRKGDRLPPERGLSERFGVSRSTVQHALQQLTERGMIRAIQGSGSYWLCEPKGEQVKDIYIPLVLPDRQIESGCYQIIMGAENFANTHNIYLTIHIINHQTDNESAIIERLTESGFRYIILYSSTNRFCPEFYRKYAEEGVHFIFIDHHPFGVSGDLVCSDNVNGGYLLTEHLIKEGYKNILFLGKKHPMVSSITERLSGYIAALKAYSIPYREELFLSVNDLAKLPKLQKSLSGPTACFAVNNVFAWQLYTFVKSHPELFGLEMVGFDSYESSETLPFVTAVAQPFYDIGYAAVELAYRRIHDDDSVALCRYLPVTLQIRRPPTAGLPRRG